MYISGALFAFSIGFLGGMLQANWRKNYLHENESFLRSLVGAMVSGLIWAILSWIGVFLAIIVYYKWYVHNRH
ncbi:hypothetical protein C6W91_16870 [Phaeobacter sp. SYSU ZJ3003]